MDTPDGPVCKYDSEGGQIKSGDEIFEGGVAFFLPLGDGDRQIAEKLTRRNMKGLPYWQKHPFARLDGEEATDAEWRVAMGKL